MTHWRTMMPMVLTYKSNCLRKLARNDVQPWLHHFPSSNSTIASSE